MEKGRFFRVLVLAATFLGGFGATGVAAAHKKPSHQPAPPKVSNKCTTAADCAFTTIADGDCCPSLCPPRVVSKTSAAALAKYAAQCKKPDGGCPVPECAPPRIQRTAACVSGRCVMRVAPGTMRE